MTEDEARARFAAVRVARLATVGTDGRPHLVPIVFAIDGSTLYFPVDHKPKSTTALKRLANIAANPHVSVLADHYDEEWTQLWWVRADGTADVREVDDVGRALLLERYPQYAGQPPFAAIVAVTITRWRGWRAS